MDSASDRVKIAEDDCSLRDCCGIPVYCNNQQALELYNQGLLEFIKGYGDYRRKFEKTLELDSQFFLVNCTLGCILLFSKPPNDPLVIQHLTVVNQLTSEQILPREKFHVDAFKAYASGDLPGACVHWEASIVEYPRDALAIILLFKGRKILGEFQQLRDDLASVIPHWSKDDDVLYPYMLGLYSFTLQETGRFQDAEAAAYQSLEMSPQSAWATHALSHVFQEDKDAKEGIEFMTSTRNDWEKSAISCHINWHLCLYYIDISNVETVLKEYDTNLVHQFTPDNMLSLVDATSLLWRLHCLGVDVGDRWDKVQKLCEGLLDRHILPWYDAHLMMSLAHTPAGNEAAAKFLLAEQLIKSLQEYSQSDVRFDCKIVKMVGIPICQALMAYGKQQFEEVVSLLYPIRYNIVHIGGSRAQRSVFSHTLIHAAINSRQFKLALSLIAELKMQ
ncbi:tetratricopeptide repeat protein 38-like isoform X2 [Dysidea avara]|uniref:tetratricopeptide repeat protein 38-like isoform X2 n=1 Tax=Dysidea avara TaxID=196820 RepID=UPI003328D3AF